MLRFDRLTLKAQEAVEGAQEIAGKHGNQQLEPLHLLAALLAEREGIVFPVLQKLDVPPDALALEVERAVERLPKVSGLTQHYFGPALNELFKVAFEEAASGKPKPIVRPGSRLKRNDPCPCGSGKKYKKCCLNE